MAGLFDDEIERDSFESLDEYYEYRIREGMAGHDYEYDTETIVDWAQALIDNYQWDALQDWMDWDYQDMIDFWDWWRDTYGEA